jgi:hypothetical protein
VENYEVLNHVRKGDIRESITRDQSVDRRILKWTLRKQNMDWIEMTEDNVGLFL